MVSNFGNYDEILGRAPFLESASGMPDRVNQIGELSIKSEPSTLELVLSRQIINRPFIVYRGCRSS